MTTLLHFPLRSPLPDIRGAEWELALSSREWETYSIGVRVKDPLRKPELLRLVRAQIANHPLFTKKIFSPVFPHIELIFDEVAEKVVVQIIPVILTGRYTKLVRTIAQTRHFCFECKGTGRKNNQVCPVCNGEKVLTKESVQELIAPFFMKSFNCSEILFHGAGREDVDVRMLGNGRPFALTLENPLKRNGDMSALQNQINSSLKEKVQLHDLRLGRPDDVAHITQKYHTKRYRARVESREPLDAKKVDSFLNQKIDILQTTPIRVEKRRVMKERPHWVVLEKINKLSGSQIEIFVHASAGCYIKEFISGDEGRSKPSFSDWIQRPCVCNELDVLEIVDEEPGSFSVV